MLWGIPQDLFSNKNIHVTNFQQSGLLLPSNIILAYGEEKVGSIERYLSQKKKVGSIEY